MAKVVTNFASDDKEVIASIEKMNKKLGELQEQARKVGQESESAGGLANQAFENMLVGAGAALAPMALLSKAVEVYNDRMQQAIDLQDKAAQTQRSAAGGQREFMMNLGLVPGADQQKALSRLKDISKKTGVAESSLYGPAGAALSASGGNVDMAFDATERAATIAPHSVETMQLIAGAIIDLGKATGKFDNTRGLDLLVKTGEFARAPDWAKVANNAPAGIIGTSKFGFSAEEATALLAAYSNAMGDKDMNVSGSASITMASRLSKFFPEEDVKNKKGRVTQKGYGKMSGSEQFAAIEGDEELRKAFHDSLEEGKEKPFIKAMTTPGTRENLQYHEFRDSLNAMPRGASQGFGAGLNNTALQQRANEERRLNRASEDSYLSLDNAARRSYIRVKVGEAIGRNVDNDFNSPFLPNKDPLKRGITLLERELSNRSTGVFAGSESNQAALTVLQNMLTELRDIKKAQQAVGAGNKPEGR